MNDLLASIRQIIADDLTDRQGLAARPRSPQAPARRTPLEQIEEEATRSFASALIALDPPHDESGFPGPSARPSAEPARRALADGRPPVSDGRRPEGERRTVAGPVAFTLREPGASSAASHRRPAATDLAPRVAGGGPAGAGNGAGAVATSSGRIAAAAPHPSAASERQSFARTTLDRAQPGRAAAAAASLPHHDDPLRAGKGETLRQHAGAQRSAFCAVSGELEAAGDLRAEDQPSLSRQRAQDDRPLTSATTRQSARRALEEFSLALSSNRRTGDTSSGSLEELVREMIRPQLRAWLDAHLAEIVTREVRREIQRLRHDDG